MISDPFFHAITIGIAVLAAFFVSVVVGLVMALPSKALRGSRRVVA